jgi:hypothetical protein
MPSARFELVIQTIERFHSCTLDSTSKGSAVEILLGGKLNTKNYKASAIGE